MPSIRTFSFCISRSPLNPAGTILLRATVDGSRSARPWSRLSQLMRTVVCSTSGQYVRLLGVVCLTQKWRYIWLVLVGGCRTSRWMAARYSDVSGPDACKACCRRASGPHRTPPRASTDQAVAPDRGEEPSPHEVQTCARSRDIRSPLPPRSPHSLAPHPVASPLTRLTVLCGLGSEAHKWLRAHGVDGVILGALQVRLERRKTCLPSSTKYR